MTEAKPISADEVLARVGRELDDMLISPEPISPVEARLVRLLTVTVRVLMATRSKMGDPT